VDDNIHKELGIFQASKEKSGENLDSPLSVCYKIGIFVILLRKIRYLTPSAFFLRLIR